jgi:hypothetical protein
VATTAAPTTTLPQTTTTPPTTEPPTTTTTVDPMAVAPLQYTALAYENNTALAAINAKYANTLSERNLRATCAETAPVVEAFANGVASTAWPEPVQDEAAALAKDAAAGAGDLYDCANARTAADAIPAWNRYADRGGDAASAMRLALGLPIERTT